MQIVLCYKSSFSFISSWNDHSCLLFLSKDLTAELTQEIGDDAIARNSGEFGLLEHDTEYNQLPVRLSRMEDYSNK